MIRENKEYLCKCVCKESSEKVLKSNTKRSEDLAAVISLPDQWIPQRSGQTLTNYLKKREDNYKATLCSMLKDTTIVDNDIGGKVRDLAENIYTHIKENHKTIECIFNDFLIAKDKSPKAHDLALQEVEKIYDESVKDIEQFQNNVLQLETFRSEGLKSIFQNNFQKLVSVEHYTPNNILQDFDEHVHGLNDKLITNLKAYFELVCQLRTHLDEISNHTRGILNQYCLTSPISADSVHINNSGKFLESKKGDELDVKKVVVCLVDAGQGAISKLCGIFFNYLDNLQKNINNINFHVKYQVLSDLEKNIDDGLQRIFKCCIEYDILERDDQIRKIIDYMRDSLCGFGESLCSTYSVLYDICHILNATLVRLALARKLTLAQIEDLQMNNDAEEFTNEISFNIALEQMLASPDVDKVQHQFDILNNVLQKQDSAYYKHSVSEVNKLKEYLILVLHLIDIFYLECACYLKAKSSIFHLTDENKPFTSDLESALLSYSKTQGFLPRSILQDQNKYTSLSNWRNEFLVSLESEIPNLRNILNEQDQKWIDEKCLILNMRYSLKSMSHSVRMERVLAARNTRMTEIGLHESRLKSHLDIIHQLIETLPTEASKFVDFDSKKLYPLNYWVTQIQNNINLLFGQSDSNIDELQIDPELKKLKLQSYGLRLLKYRQLFEESLESAANLYKKNVEIRIQSARTANFEFMKEIKLFNEGGDYAVAEAVKTSAILDKAADTLESCANVTIDAVNRCQTHLLSLAEELLSPVMQIANEGSRRSGLHEKPHQRKK